jgi:hypothetical protein
MHLNGDLVCHGAGRTKQSRFHPEKIGHTAFQSIYSNVFPKYIITNFGRNYYNFDAVLKSGGEVIHSSGPLAKAGVYLVHGVETTGNDLPPATTVWVKASL